MIKWIKKKFRELDRYITWAACENGCHPRRFSEDLIESHKRYRRESPFYPLYINDWDNEYYHALRGRAKKTCCNRHCCLKDPQKKKSSGC